MELIIVTGLSGSGKSTALNILEDLNFFTMDNIPLKFTKDILKELKLSGKYQKIAFGLDIRTIINERDFDLLFEQIKVLEIDFKVIFLESSIQSILNRYNLTRRKHPILKQSLLESINSEIHLMEELRGKSNLIIDTTNLSTKELAKKIEETIKGFSKSIYLNIHLQSFGFKYGIPLDCDMVFDARVLPNPYYIANLRDKTGIDNEVFDYVMSFQESEDLYQKILELIKFLIPGYLRDEKKHLTVGIGCSGGKHRSVSIVRRLETDLKNLDEINITTFHREKERGNW